MYSESNTNRICVQIAYMLILTHYQADACAICASTINMMHARIIPNTRRRNLCSRVCVSFAKGLTNLMETTPSPGKKRKASAKRNFCTEDESDENLEQTLGEEEGEKEEQKGAGDGDTHDDEWVDSFVDEFPKIKPKTTKPEKSKGKTNGKAKAKAKAKGKGKAKAAASPKAETPPKEARPIQKKGLARGLRNQRRL